MKKSLRKKLFHGAFTNSATELPLVLYLGWRALGIFAACLFLPGYITFKLGSNIGNSAVSRAPQLVFNNEGEFYHRAGSTT